MSVSASAPVRIIDRPCGYGKTTLLLSSFKEDRKYLVVVPTLDEVQRVIQGAKVPFVEPETNSEHSTKRQSLEALLCQGANVVTTHALYVDVAILARRGLSRIISLMYL